MNAEDFDRIRQIVREEIKEALTSNFTKEQIIKIVDDEELRRLDQKLNILYSSVTSSPTKTPEPKE